MTLRHSRSNIQNLWNKILIKQTEIISTKELAITLDVRYLITLVNAIKDVFVHPALWQNLSYSSMKGIQVAASILLAKYSFIMQNWRLWFTKTLGHLFIVYHYLKNSNIWVLWQFQKDDSHNDDELQKHWPSTGPQH